MSTYPNIIAAKLTALSADNARLREKAIVGEYMWTPGEVMEVVARAEAAEARVTELVAALRPFAEIADFVDAETEGFTDTDEFKLHFQDYLMASWPLSATQKRQSSLGLTVLAVSCWTMPLTPPLHPSPSTRQRQE